MKQALALVLLLGLAGCSSLQERLAKKVGCDQNKLVVTSKVEVPAYSQYEFTCEGRAYTCRDAPFHSSCEENKADKKPPTIDEPPAKK